MHDADFSHVNACFFFSSLFCGILFICVVMRTFLVSTDVFLSGSLNGGDGVLAGSRCWIPFLKGLAEVFVLDIVYIIWFMPKLRDGVLKKGCWA